MTTATRTHRAGRRKGFTPLTEEQRAERRARVAAMASTATAGLADSPERWRAFLWAAAMHPERPGVVNLALIAAQAPHEVVDDYHGWRRRGRQVRKGETGRVLIFTSMGAKRRKNEENEEKEQQNQRVRFGTGTVFTAGQTQPREDIEQVEDSEPRPPYRADAAQVAQAAAAALAAHGVEAEADPENARTLLGILARKRHSFGQSAALPGARVEGEAAAYVAAVMLGLPDPGPAPIPDMPLVADEKDPHREIKATAERVVTLGRRLAAELAR